MKILTSILLLACSLAYMPAFASDTLLRGNAGQTLFHDAGSSNNYVAAICEASDGSGNVAQAATAANQATANTSLASIDGKTLSRVAVAPARLDTSGTNVTTSAYVQIVASTAGAINKVYIYNGGTSDMVMAVGAAASEADKVAIGPSGWSGPYDLNIPASSRISVKAKSGTQSSGALLFSFIQ